MRAAALFQLLRERISHSIMDGRILTASGPEGDDGLRRILAQPMVVEELCHRLESLFRVGEEILGLQSDQVFGRIRPELSQQLSFLRTALAKDPTTLDAGVLRATVTTIRELLRQAGDESLFALTDRPVANHTAASFSDVAMAIVGLIASALAEDLSRAEAQSFASEYWQARVAAEEGIVETAVAARGRGLVHNSIEDVLWSLRAYDEVAEIAISCRWSANERRLLCEKLLGGTVAEKLEDVVGRTRAMVRTLATKGE